MITKRRLICLILMVSMMGAFMAGCSERSLSPDQMDRSPFTSIPCAAPCWYGLVIGKSSESDVMSTLPTLTFISQESIYPHQMSMTGLDPFSSGSGVEITANCIQPSKSCLTLRVVDDVLTEVEVELNYEIRLDEAIRYLGDPDYIGYQMLSHDRIMCEVNLVWISRQLVLASKVFDSYDTVENTCGVVRDTGKIVSSLEISKVRYLPIETIELTVSNSDRFFAFSGTIPVK